ncbi:hypothetical protein OS175_13305 [Marinicella sp. S1101]|uniref:carboxylesterase family protein n=1 Tax=Marinicella marina TaxID=2996016 RepID=UPI0022609D8E|nr:PHB depolymerase family esterase [Marinicella marina]MCX7554851.1 hypothetical protein [Marinicella marina]MDJ1141509.1 hypothetical protein [Marinicella marina]
MKKLLLILTLMCPYSLLAGDVIARFGFEITDDLPILDDPTGFPSDRHTPRPIGSTASAQGYYEYLPPGYDEGDQDYPLIVFIHGLGENGDGDAQLDDLLDNGIPKLIDDNQWDETRPFVVLSPQNSQGSCTRSAAIFDFINYAKEQYRINPNRVYLTGLSCGAIGSWNYLGNHTNTQIAAVVPIAGNGNSAFTNGGCEMNRVPIWAFHGDNDSVVNVGGTTNPINNLLACSDPAPIDTSMVIYPGVGHDSWTRTYNLSAGHDIYSWFLTKKNMQVVVPEPLMVGNDIKVDFGIASGASPDPWNNVSNLSGAVINALDNQLSSTTVSFTITDSFDGTNQNGIGANSLGLPEMVTADNFWAGSFDGHDAALLESAAVTISGLDQMATYDLELYASRTGDDGGRFRLTRYTIGATSLDMEVSDNTAGSVIFDDISGSDSIILEITVSPDGTGRFAYLGGLKLSRIE